MKWFGVTGGIASGKTTFCKYLEELGYPVIYADQIARDVVKAGTSAYKKIVDLFGETILDEVTQEIDRKRLGKLVFSNKKLRESLEEIIHPEVKKEVLIKRNSYEELGSYICFYEIPLLFEKNLKSQFDKVILIYADRTTQIERLKDRDKINETEALIKVESQISNEQKKSESDYVFYNSMTSNYDREVKEFQDWLKTLEP